MGRLLLPGLPPGNVLGKAKQALILGSREYSHESRNGDTHSHRIPVRPDVPCSFHPFSTLSPHVPLTTPLSSLAQIRSQPVSRGLVKQQFSRIH